MVGRTFIFSELGQDALPSIFQIHYLSSGQFAIVLPINFPEEPKIFYSRPVKRSLRASTRSWTRKACLIYTSSIKQYSRRQKKNYDAIRSSGNNIVCSLNIGGGCYSKHFFKKIC